MDPAPHSFSILDPEIVVILLKFWTWTSSMVFNFWAIFFGFFQLRYNTLLTVIFKKVFKAGSGSAWRKQMDPDPQKKNADPHSTALVSTLIQMFIFYFFISKQLTGKWSDASSRNDSSCRSSAWSSLNSSSMVNPSSMGRRGRVPEQEERAAAGQRLATLVLLLRGLPIQTSITWRVKN